MRRIPKAAGITGQLKTTEQMKWLVSNGKVHLFPTGGHPAILTNAEDFADVVKAFFKE